LHEPAAEEHGDQDEMTEMVKGGQAHAAFEEAFETGDELFETLFNALDGGGANVGGGQRFTRTPRADLSGAGEWANHFPSRATGPNAQACSSCHNQPADDGAGAASGNVHRDPLHSGNLGQFIQRNTPHVFAPGAVQRLAEEMTEALHLIRDQAKTEACASGASTKTLTAKGVGFGTITVTRTSASPCQVQVNTTGVQGVSADLVVRPFQWKGSVASLRDFNRGAAHNELGMQAVELVGEGQDGDFDGVENEMTIGDMTALAVYLASQPRPTTKLELASLGLIQPLPAHEVTAINRGAQIFQQVGCSSCHTPQLTINDPVFREPSANPNFRDAVFPAGQNPLAEGCDPSFPVSFDLTKDQPDNVLRDANGNVVFRLGSLQKDGQGRAVVALFGDLKRHNLGPDVAESIDEVGTGASVFLTENLWGVGTTAPYLHDGRASTLTEAILAHGGEAAAARAAFDQLGPPKQKDLIAFLDNLVLFKIPED
jgi:cytochrome c peroxidase